MTLSYVLFLAGWQVASLGGLVPGPLTTLERVLSLKPGEVFSNLLRTLYNGVAGFSLSFLVSMTLSVLAQKNYVIRGVIRGLSEMFNSTSALVWSLVLVATLGVLNPLPPILVVSAVTAPHLLSAVTSAINSVDKGLVEAVRSLGASQFDEFMDVLLPSSVPILASASRVGIGTALRISVVAEAFGGGGGVGYMLMRSYNLADVEGVLAWSVILFLTVLAMDKLLAYLEGGARKWQS